MNYLNQVENFSENYSILTFNLREATSDLDAGNGRNGKKLKQTLETSLAHELAHFENNLNYLPNSKIDYPNGGLSDAASDEPYAVAKENQVRRDFGLEERTHYAGLNVYNKDVTRSNNTYNNYKLINNSKSESIPPYQSGIMYWYNVNSVESPYKEYKTGGNDLRHYLISIPKYQYILYEKKKD